MQEVGIHPRQADVYRSYALVDIENNEELVLVYIDALKCRYDLSSMLIRQNMSDHCRV